VNKNALPLKAAVVKYAVFSLRHVLVAVEPSFQAHDVWSMSASRYQYEWEIKQSMEDLYREMRKYKHQNGGLPAMGGENKWRAEYFPNYFSFVVPKKMEASALRWIERKLPFAGLATCDPYMILVRRPRRIHKGRAPLKRCSMVARWMARSLADTMAMHIRAEEFRALQVVMPPSPSETPPS
jgi:hypothetical protein